MPSKKRAPESGFRKTSYDLTEAAKFAIEDLAAELDRDGYRGVSETVVVEALILSAQRAGVDRNDVERALRNRRTAHQKAAKGSG